MKKEKELMKNSFDCIKCKDTFWIISNQGKATRCTCFEQQSIKEQWKAAGLKIDDLDKTFKSYETWNNTTKNIKTVATNYCLRFEKIRSDRNNSILLCGNPGVGKTHLSIALANNFMKKGIKVVYMPYRDILTSLKQNILDKEYYKKLITKYKEAQILLIDDLYKGKITEADINIMFEIVNHRYINKLPMIVSSEFTIEHILGIDEAIGSRIYEMSKEFIFEVRGKENNYRLRTNNG